MWVKKISLIALSAAVLFGVAGCFKHTPEEKAEWITDRISSKLELDESQQQKLASVKDEVLALRAAMHEDREARFEKADEMIRSDYIAPADIKAIWTDKEAIINRHADELAQKVSDFHASLNAEQKAKAAEYIQKKRDRHFGDYRH